MKPGDQVVHSSGFIGIVVEVKEDYATILAATTYFGKALEEWSVIPRLLRTTGRTPSRMFLTWTEKKP